jgi:hypothetical protein
VAQGIGPEFKQTPVLKKKKKKEKMQNYSGWGVAQW